MPKEANNKEKKVKKAKPSKEKRNFFKATKAELKKVIWPTPKQLLNNTLAVIVIVLLIGVIVFVLDVCFEKINSLGVDGLKSVIQTTNNTEESTDNSEISSDETNTDTDSENQTETATDDTTDTTSENADGQVEESAE